MTCSIIRSLLDDYVDRELPASTVRSIKTHLNRCAACRIEEEALRRLKALLPGLTPPEPEPTYWREVSGLITARTTQRDRTISAETEMERLARERASFYRSILALAASLAMFFSALALGPNLPGGFTDRSPLTGEDGPARSGAVTFQSEGAGMISHREQALITSGMLLVGSPAGMFVSPTDMAMALGLDRER